VSTILIVEDDRHTRDGLCELLRSEGYDVNYARTASAALLKLDSRVALLLSDLKLPNFSGLELCEKVMKRNPDLKSIIMTAYTSEEVYKKAKKVGVYSWLAKPLDIDLLFKLVADVLSSVPVAKTDVSIV